ncbi:MAG: hypothetical protein Q7W55_06215 [Pseudohongiella sp.]|nr:hypothetical protein [Pseudohongiella sp.]MDO9521607.1 hypothetical protein [Pseudohongiella sp.]
MNTPENIPDDFSALLRPLPELDGRAFTQSVLLRTKRIQVWRRILQLLTYLCVAAVIVATLPWPSVTTGLSNLAQTIAPSMESLAQISVLTEWLPAYTDVRHILTQEIIVIAALASLLGGAVSLVMTEG